MATDHDTALLGEAVSLAVGPAGAVSATDWTASKLVAQVAGQLDPKTPRFVACAPGRLDIMGGIIEYTGGLVLNTTVADHVCAAAQRISKPVLRLSLPNDTGAFVNHEFAFEKVCAGLLTNEFKSLLSECIQSEPMSCELRCCLGAVQSLFTKAADHSRGLHVSIGSKIRDLPAIAPESATIAAIMVAVAKALDVTIQWQQAADLAREIGNNWLQTSLPNPDVLCTLTGEAHTITQFRCGSAGLGSAIPLPDHFVFAGIDSGFHHPKAKEKECSVRTATMMGRVLIERIIEYEGAGSLPWNGHLSRVSINDYVDRFRDRLPTKLRGRDFLSRFGQLSDPYCTINEAEVYKVRSRCEHHVYENARAHQFVDGLSRAIRLSDRDTLISVGELMYSSHWSYGQRCGLGSVQTDLLVNLLRRRGLENDIYGAKVTARGCGGTVVVLLRSTDKAREALKEVVKIYQKKANLPARIVAGSSHGAIVSSAQSI